MNKVLLVTDMHFRESDPPSIKGYVKVIERVFNDLINYVSRNNVDYVIFLGDIFDRGYKSQGMADSHKNLFRRLKQICPNLYNLVGNHFYLERDSNPELYLCLPNNKPYLQPSIPDMHTEEEPVLRVVDNLIVGCMEFSFHHFQRGKIKYIWENPTAKYHHALYHEKGLLPKYMSEFNEGLSEELIKELFANVDMATFGDLHSAVGPCSPYGIPFDVPGSMCINNRIYGLHDHVNLPLYLINDDDYEKEYVTFRTYVEDLTFKENVHEKALEKKKQEMRQEIKEDNYNADITGASTFSEWLDVNCHSREMRKHIISATKNSFTLGDLYKQEEDL